MPDTQKTTVSRRTLLAGLGAGGGVLTLTAHSSAEAAILLEPDRKADCDVAVIGSGAAGCAAASEAAGAGARVVMLEKAQARWMGGNSFLAGGGFSMPLARTAQARDDHVEDYTNFCLGRGNATIFRQMAESIEEDLAWLEGHGISFEALAPWPPSRVRMAIASPGFFAGMPAFFRRMRARLEEMGCDLVFETKARQLLMDTEGAVRGVAALTGLPAETMQQTIATYNAAVSDGTAAGAEPPKAQLASRIKTPPFYASSPLVPGITLTFGGVMIDTAARALEADGRVIEGLFAAGECAGATFFHDYIGGGALTQALVTGRIAGRGAAA